MLRAVAEASGLRIKSGDTVMKKPRRGFSGAFFVLRRIPRSIHRSSRRRRMEGYQAFGLIAFQLRVALAVEGDVAEGGVGDTGALQEETDLIFVRHPDAAVHLNSF